jgi:ubiquinol-cytochrome c reductase cytochrome b subunit
MNALRRLWRWFDGITGLSLSVGPILRHPVPPMRKLDWMYVLGSATLISFLVQVVTGISLATAYITSTGSAYDSLKLISSAPVGRVVRGIHYFGASAMILLIGLHTIRVYLTGSYKFPRQFNWLTGAGLLAFTLLMGFTGQLLRWDQTGFWTAVIAANQAGRTPVIGSWIGHFILAGDTAGGATLSRFFATHVFFIPAAIFLFLAFHLYLLVYNGISEPPKSGRPVDVRTYRDWYKHLLRREGKPFWPDAAWRDAVFGTLVVVVIIALAIVVGAPELGMPPDPTITDASPRPDWYFMWYFAVLSLIPKWSEDYVIFLGPLFFGLALILLPLVAGRGERSPLRRPWSLVVAGLVVVIIAHFWTVGNLAPWSPRFNAQPLPPLVVGTTAGPVAAGSKLFYEKGCEYCHAVSGYGGIRGPDLTSVGDRMNRNQAATRILSGAANMPSYVGILTPAELNALLDFLDSRTAAAAAGVPSGKTPPP